MDKTDKRTYLANVVVAVTANGYIAYAAPLNNQSTPTASEQYVFEKFEHLVKFLEKELLKPTVLA